jgi:hypothetical protein
METLLQGGLGALTSFGLWGHLVCWIFEMMAALLLFLLFLHLFALC